MLFVIHTSKFAHISQSTGYVNETKCRAELLFIPQELIGLWKSGRGIPDRWLNKSGVYRGGVKKVRGICDIIRNVLEAEQVVIF